MSAAAKPPVVAWQGRSRLQGADASRVSLLRDAADRAGFEAVLTLADIKTTHTASADDYDDATGIRGAGKATVLTSMLGDGEPPDQMDMPRLAGPSFDQVLIGDAPAGVSTGRTVSPALRAMISLCVIDRAHAAPGTQVTVLWGRPDTPQRKIRATVTMRPNASSSVIWAVPITALMR